jgi:spore coat protein U-like protein
VSFLGTITVLASHSLSLISLMKFASSSLLTSTPIASARGSDSRRMDCLTGLESGNTLSACSANSLGTPGMSAGHHAKISQRSRRNSTSALSYAGLRSLAISAVLEASVEWTCTFFVLTVESNA